VIGLATGLVFSGANWNRPETAWMSRVLQQLCESTDQSKLYHSSRFVKGGKRSQMIKSEMD